MKHQNALLLTYLFISHHSAKEASLLTSLPYQQVAIFFRALKAQRKQKINKLNLLSTEAQSFVKQSIRGGIN